MAAPTAAGVTAGATRAGAGTAGAGRSWGWIAAGFATALAALLLFIAVPTVLITQQNECATGSVANGVADPIDLDALTIATRIYDVGRDMRMAEGQLLSAYIAVLVESGGGVTMRNPPDGDRSSVGAFQQQDLPEWTHDARNRLNVSDAARSYFEAARKHDAPGISPGELATRVQRMDARYAGLAAFWLWLDTVLKIDSLSLYGRLNRRVGVAGLVLVEKLLIAPLVAVALEHALFDQELRPFVVAVAIEQGVVEIEQNQFQRNAFRINHANLSFIDSRASLTNGSVTGRFCSSE